MTDFRTPPSHEPGPQPDPMLQPGRRSSSWIWLAALAILVVVVTTLYGLNNQESQTASNEPAPAQVNGSNAAPQSGDETTGAAPQDQQNNDQDKGAQDKGAQKSGNGQQAGSANSPNNAAPQKQQGSQTNQQPQKKQ